MTTVITSPHPERIMGDMNVTTSLARLGFKGRRIGGALPSPQHANFIVSDGTATAADVLAPIAEIGDAVERETGYRMEAEAKYVTPEGRFVAADQVLAS